MECGQCKDCRWWEDPATEDSEGFDCCGSCHMMTFKGGKTVDVLSPVAETTLIQHIYFDFTGETCEIEDKNWEKIQSFFPGIKDNTAKIFTPRFFGCVMFEQRVKNNG